VLVYTQQKHKRRYSCCWSCDVLLYSKTNETQIRYVYKLCFCGAGVECIGAGPRGKWDWDIGADASLVEDNEFLNSKLWRKGLITDVDMLPRKDTTARCAVVTISGPSEFDVLPFGFRKHQPQILRGKYGMLTECTNQNHVCDFTPIFASVLMAGVDPPPKKKHIIMT
jgi:hypothetical protein